MTAATAAALPGPNVVPNGDADDDLRRQLLRRLDPRSLPLFWKLLLPFFGLMVVVGTAGTFVVMRDLGARAQTRLDQDLSRRLVEARAAIGNRELYLLESANFASNLQGMPAATRAGDSVTARRLLESVAALKTELNFLLVTDRNARPLVVFRRDSAGDPLISGSAGPEITRLASSVLRSPTGDKAAAMVTSPGPAMLAIAGPVCSGTASCDVSGVAIVALDVSAVARAAAGLAGAADPTASGVAVFDESGDRIATTGLLPAGAPPAGARTQLVRVAGRSEGRPVNSVYAPLTLQGQRRGSIAVTLPTGETLDSVRDSAYRLAAIVLLAMIGVVALGALLSKYILSQVGPLLATSRALGRGELTARARVLAGDELGELATGLNQMADELQASHAYLESRVEQRTAEVQRLMQERSNFFAMLSHELRTPLAIILNQADLLSGSGVVPDGPTTTEAAEAIRESGTQVLNLINDILAMARAEAGRLEIDIEPVDVRMVLEEISGTLRGLAQARQVSLHVALPRSMPKAMADPRRLQEVVLNLVDNAVKYTPTGGSVEVVASVTDDAVQVRVRDTGVGIPEHVGAEIFEPFYRVATTHTQHGEASTGLGLALSYRLMTAQGGGLHFERVPDGSVFVATLPCATRRTAGTRSRTAARRRRS